MAKIFISYSHADEEQRERLEKHLSPLRREGLISIWHDRRLAPGDNWKDQIDSNIADADVVLLLISADFIASDYCYEKELQIALERHNKKEAVVVPVIIRECDWKTLPFGRIQALPKDAKPITKFLHIDEGLTQVAVGIRQLLKEHSKFGATDHSSNVKDDSRPISHSRIETTPSRSSNLSVRKEFSEIQRAEFLDEAFEYMARYFEQSLEELSKRHNNIETRYRRESASKFTASVYKNGKLQSSCYIRVANLMGRGIAYSASEGMSDNGFNEQVRVEADDQSMYLVAIMMSAGYSRDQKWTFEGAAEHYWSKLVTPLQ